MDWQSISDWRFVCPPSRPGAHQLNFVERAIKDVDHNRPVAVLGSTVEYRDLLSTLGFKNIFVIDKNHNFHQLVTRLRRYRTAESLITADWLGCEKRTGSLQFAFVLSHLTSGNIHYELRTNFYHSVSQILAHDGFLVDYVLTNQIGYVGKDYLFDRYRQSPINIMQANNFSCEALFCSEFCEALGVVDSSRTYDTILKEFGEEFRELVSLAELVTPRGGLWYYGKPWSEVRRSQFAHFDVVRVDDDETHSVYNKRAKNFVMRKL